MFSQHMTHVGTVIHALKYRKGKMNDFVTNTKINIREINFTKLSKCYWTIACLCINKFKKLFKNEYVSSTHKFNKFYAKNWKKREGVVCTQLQKIMCRPRTTLEQSMKRLKVLFLVHSLIFPFSNIIEMVPEVET